MLRIRVGNILPEISTIPAVELANYKIFPRYYLGLVLAGFSVATVLLPTRSRVGPGMWAAREDEAAAEASGVNAFGHKLLALAISTSLTGLAGGLFAFYHVGR
jgi:branched-chain amino acid transport system permease protein